MTTENIDFMPTMEDAPATIEMNVEPINNDDAEVLNEEAKEAEADDEPIPEVKEKTIIPQEDIFKKGYKEDDKLEFPVVKKVKRPRKPMSEEHKAKLAKAREKSLAIRRANAEKKKKGEKVLSKRDQLKLKENEEFLSRVEVKNMNYTKEEIADITREATAKALRDYEAVRKDRKVKKRERLRVEEEKKKIQTMVQQANGRRLGENGYFANCF
jgi:hypothetical protein